MHTIDGSGLLQLLVDGWTYLNTVRVDLGIASFTIIQFEVACVFVNLILDFMCPFWFGDIERRALRDHHKGAYEWD